MFKFLLSPNVVHVPPIRLGQFQWKNIGLMSPSPIPSVATILLSWKKYGKCNNVVLPRYARDYSRAVGRSACHRCNIETIGFHGSIGDSQSLGGFYQVAYPLLAIPAQVQVVSAGAVLKD